MLRVWTSGLCSCAEGSTCASRLLTDACECLTHIRAVGLLACVCPCIVFSKVKRRSEHLAQAGLPDPEHGGGCCTSDCMLHCCVTSFFGVGWVFQVHSRELSPYVPSTQLFPWRRCYSEAQFGPRYGIKGSICTDCLVGFCCTPCELSQESYEVALEERSFQNCVHV